MPATPDAPQVPLIAPHAGHTFGRAVLFMVGLCTAIAGLLTAIDGGGFPTKLIYSFSVGVCCWGMTWMAIVGVRILVRWRHGGQAPVVTGGPDVIGWKGLIPAVLLGMVLGPPLGMTMGDLITGLRSPSLLQWGSTSTRITIALSLIGTAAAMYAMTAIERLARSRAEAEAARRLAAETQLKLLEAQLEPHMLFNTLANLRVLIGLDATQAQAMLDRLIAFLRAVLGASRTDRHSLQTEFERIGDYLALMGYRMGARLQTTLELPPELRGAVVPPLLLQPLVENSIRHGLEPQVGPGRIEVRARQQGTQLVLTVRDTGAGLAVPSAPGGTRFGLQQVRTRLATLYGDAASFTLAAPGDADGGAEARIEMPLTFSS